MWIKVSIIMEVLAAALLAVEVLLSKSRLTKIDNWLLSKLKRNIVHKGQVRSIVAVAAGVVTLLIMVGIVVWGFTVDFQKRPLDNLVVSSVMLMAGAFAGVAMVGLLVWLYGKWRVLTRLDPISYVSLSTILLAFSSIYMLSSLSHFVSSQALVSYFVAFAFAVSLTGIWIAVLPVAQKYLTFQSGVLIRLGLFIFIAAKMMQLFAAS